MNRTTVQCKACGALMVFLSTRSGKKMPVDASSIEAHELMFDHTKHKSHFATCPEAEQFRKPA